MSGPVRRRPTPRLRVAVVAVGLLLLLGTVVVLGEVLRHPYERASDIPESELAGSDPRDPLQCPDPQPREGQQRAGDVGFMQPVTVSSNELYDCPEFYDGRQVIYRGEVVGALLERDVGVWTQLNDDVYAELLGPLPAHSDYRGGNAGVGVLLPPETAAAVSFVGGPQTRGDVLEVRGTFYRVDPSGEVAVIWADSGERVVTGSPFPDPPLTDRQVAAWIAIAVAGGLVVLERFVAARR